MNILDENILASQRQLLSSWRLRMRQIGFDIGRSGLQDDEILLLLLQQPHPMFFTCDVDYFHPALRHARYGLAFLAVDKNEVAPFVRRFLRHSMFNTHDKRMGNIVRVSSADLIVWQLRALREVHIDWE